MLRRVAALLTLLLLTRPTLAQLAIEGLDKDDLALLTHAAREVDTLHFDTSLDVAGDPGVTDGLALDGPGAIGADDAGRPLVMLELDGLYNPGGADEAPLMVRLRLVDDNLYLQMSDEEPWQVFPLPAESLAAAGLVLDPGGLVGARALDFPGWLLALGLDAYSSGARADADGRARFRIDVDLDAWLLSDRFNDLLKLVGAAAGDESLAHMGPLLAEFLQELSLGIEAAVELESRLLRRLVFELDVSLNAAMAGSPAESAAGSLLLILDDMSHGGSLAVSVPEHSGSAQA